MRSTLGSTPLVRLLAPWTAADAEPSGMDFAERLSLWLNAFDAIRLQSALQAIRAADSRAGRGQPQRAPDLAEDLRRVRSVLTQAIAQPVDAQEPGYAPWQQRHAELQRQMDLMVAPVREHARQALARLSPRLRQLALLDAALEPLLAGREQALLPRLPALLKRRFDQLRSEGAALDVFAADWRQALAAELELRLSPVAGLVEALAKEWNKER